MKEPYAVRSAADRQARIVSTNGLVRNIGRVRPVRLPGTAHGLRHRISWPSWGTSCSEAEDLIVRVVPKIPFKGLRDKASSPGASRVGGDSIPTSSVYHGQCSFQSITWRCLLSSVCFHFRFFPCIPSVNMAFGKGRDEKRGPSAHDAPYPPSYTQPASQDLFVPQSYTQDSVPVKPPRSFVKRQLFWALRYFAVVVVVGALLAIPIIVSRKSAIVEDDDPDIANKNLIFYIFLWLLITWLAGTAADLTALALPYIYRLLARYFNPAHQKYWRMFRAMRRPIRFMGTFAFCFITFTVVSTEEGSHNARHC